MNHTRKGYPWRLSEVGLAYSQRALGGGYQSRVAMWVMVGWQPRSWWHRHGSLLVWSWGVSTKASNVSDNPGLGSIAHGSLLASNVGCDRVAW